MDPTRESRAREIFREAIEISPEDVQSSLEFQCGDDAALRERVERLLQAHVQCQGLYGSEGVPLPAGVMLDATNESGEGAVMRLSEGAKLGPFEIQALLGAGGMGEVYRARDTRLDRVVAVKVLPEATADRDHLRQRLLREAKAVSRLNHPHICALYDVGHEEGVDFLVMEYLEGDTLAARIERGPMPIDELLCHATEIADALAVAHRRGLVHRDLKPGNVMLTASGAKLLDFGLAKAVGGATLDSSSTAAPSPLTARGTIVGTLHYMAPELLEGGEADARSDIFAFGAVLYEMATGRKAFQHETHAGLIASIIKEQPPAWPEQPLLPPPLQRLIATCLQKNPEARRQTMSDVLLDLRWIAEGGSWSGVAAPVARRRRELARLAWAGAALAFVAASGFAFLWWRATGVPRRVVTTAIVAPEGLTLYPEDGIALSPDGTHLVFSAGEDETRMLWLRALEDSWAQPLEARIAPSTRSGRPTAGTLAFLQTAA